MGSALRCLGCESLCFSKEAFASILFQLEEAQMKFLFHISYGFNRLFFQVKYKNTKNKEEDNHYCALV